MKSLVKRYARPGLWLEDIPDPACGPNDVRVKVQKTGICGTDLHIYKWDEWAAKTIPVPMTIGHEFVGVIGEIGSNVRDFKPGMIVSGEGHVVCGRCRNCMAGRRHLCAHSSGIGVNRPGAFAEHIVLPDANVWEHFPGISREVASIFDPLGNAAHTALQWDLLGEDVLIAGAGTIGVLAAAVCRHAGARHVVVTDVNPWRLDLAKRMGATRAVNISRESLEEVQRELGMREGFDIGLEMSGNPAGLRDLINHLCHGGRISVLGIPTGAVEIDWHKVIFNMLTLKGIYGREIYDTWYKMSVMIQSGLDIAPVITHRLGFEDFERGFQAMLTGECGKVVLDWSE